MSDILWIALGVGLGLLTPLLFLRWRRGAAAPLDSRTAVPNRAQVPTQTKTKTKGPAPPSGGVKRRLALKFHGVSLKPGVDACRAVQELAGQRFLPVEAPAVPLSGCDQQNCQCAYVHHSDRRERGDRRSGWGSYGGFAPKLPGANKRGKDPDRRSRA